MSTFTIPNNKGQIRQVNSGDLFGELHETFNIDLTSSEGKIKVSKKLIPVIVESASIDISSGIFDVLIWDGAYYLVGEEVFKCSVNSDPTDSSNWSEVTGIAELDGVSNTAVPFDGKLLMSHKRTASIGDILSWDGSSDDDDWWTSIIGGDNLTASTPLVLEVVQSQKETLFVTDNNKIHYVETGGTPKTVTLDSGKVACCFAPGLSGAMWAGTYSADSGTAYVYEMYVGEVVGSTPVYRQAYPINALAVLAIWMRDNIPYIITERGEIQVFNGAGFEVAESFPFRFNSTGVSGVRAGLIQDSNRARPIHPRGVKVHNDSVYVSINTKGIADSDFPADNRSHTGVWEFNMKTRVLNHRFSYAHTSSDYGSLNVDQAYPILITDNEYTFIMAGSENESSETALYMNSSSTPQGWFVTPEISSGTITDAYEAVYHKAKTLTSGEEIVTQYRTSKRDTIKLEVSWVNTTTCTTTGDLSNADQEDLIRIVSGKSAGDYANIVTIVPSANTYTIQVDKEIGEVGTSSFIYCDNFKKDDDTYTTEDGEYKKLGGYGVNPWIQFIVFLKGDIEYRQFISKGNAKTTL
jgi:hypothetical protein